MQSMAPQLATVMNNYKVCVCVCARARACVCVEYCV